ARIDLVHVPYKGAAPAVNDLVGGQVQMVIFDVPVLLGHIGSGKLKALAVTSTARAHAPRRADHGRNELSSCHLPQLVRPGRAGGDASRHPEAPEHPCGRALKSPDVTEQFAKVGGLASPSTPQDYA